MAVLNGHKVKLIGLSSNMDLTKEISDFSGIPIADCEVSHFADGEISVNIGETVRGRHVFIVQSTCNPVNDHLMELLIMIDALKRASAKTINCIVPYYGYSRQDRKTRARQPITAKLVADLLEKAGIDRILCVDLHATQIQGFFNVPIDNFQAMPIIANYFESKKLKDVVVVAPDHGGTTRARKLATRLNVPLAIIDKRRPKPNVAEVMNIIGEVDGKTAIIIDDMIDTAGTICAAAEALIKNGATAVYASCTHPIFSGPAIERLSNSVISEVVFTNSLPLSEDKKCDKFVQLSIGKLLGQGLVNIVNDEPLSSLFNY